MKEITKNETKMTKKSIYVADDGTEFDNEYDCRIYEANIIIAQAINLFKISTVYLDDKNYYSFTYDIKYHDLFIKTLQIYANSYIDNDEIELFIDDYNIRSEDFNKQMNYINEHEFINNEIYLLRFEHHEHADSYDYYGVFIEDSKSVKSRIMSSIEKYNKIFNKNFSF